MLTTACAGAAIVAIASSANAAQCRSTIDDAGEAVILCGTVAYDADDESDEPESFDDMYEDDGTLFVDVEDCEPGNYWMLETEEMDLPMACH
jgi:hypothetical protein